MIKALIPLINKWACMHEWAQRERIQVYTSTSISFDMPSKHSLLYCCKKCGKFKKITL